MKRTDIIKLFILCVFCQVLILTACVSSGNDGEASSAVKETEAIAAETAPIAEPFPKAGYLKLYSFGTEQETYEYFSWSSTAHYDENGELLGMLSADGEGFFSPITEKEAELPVINGYCRDDGLDVRLIEGARITQINYYDLKGDHARKTFTSKKDFDDFFINSSGGCIIDITVMFEGPYIEEYDEYEHYVNGYAFILADVSAGDGGEAEDDYGFINENGWVKVISNGRITVPFQYFVSGRTNTADGEVVEEGRPLGSFLPKVLDGLPAADRSPDFTVSIYEWGGTTLVTVYDTSLNEIACFGGGGEYALCKFIADNDGEYIVDVRVCVSGCEIFEVGNQTNEYGYLFKVNAGRPAEGHEAYVTVRGNNESGREEITEPFEYFLSAYTAHYEDGVFKGMLSADGMELDCLLHEENVSLPEVYGDFELYIADGAELLLLNSYDTDMEMIGFDLTLEELRSIAASHEGGHIVEVVVGVQGDHIAEAGEYEYWTKGYAFVIK